MFRGRDNLTKSDEKKKAFTTLGIGGASAESGDEAASDESQEGERFTTLGIGGALARSADEADVNENKGSGTIHRRSPSMEGNPKPPQSDRLRELRERRDTQIKMHLEEAESALAGNDLAQARAAIEQAVVLSPDDLKVVSLLETVDQAEQERQIVQSLTLARQRLTEGALTEAATLIEQVLGQHPAHVEAMSLQSDVLKHALRTTSEAKSPKGPPPTLPEESTATIRVAVPQPRPEEVTDTHRAKGSDNFGAVSKEGSGAASLPLVDDHPNEGRRFSALWDIRLLLGVGAMAIVVGMLGFFLGRGAAPEATSSELVSRAEPILPLTIFEQPPISTLGPGPASEPTTEIEARASAIAPARGDSVQVARPASPREEAPPVFQPVSRSASPREEVPPVSPPVARSASPREEAPPASQPAARSASPREEAPPTFRLAGPVRVGGDVVRPTRTTDVIPTYPEAARGARIQGLVILETVISATGLVTDVKVLRSVDPIVDQAAVEAARQWVYTPTVLDGVAVPVIMTETVNFVMPQPVRVAGNIPRPTRTQDVAPTYPEGARNAGIQGIVILETELSATGRVTDVKVLRSVDPLVDQAAVEAARQWVYTPTMLDGVAVPIIMTETVNFILTGSIQGVDPGTLVGLNMEQVRERVGSPQQEALVPGAVPALTIWTYETTDGRVRLTFESTTAAGSPTGQVVTSVRTR